MAIQAAELPLPSLAGLNPTTFEISNHFPIFVQEQKP